MQAKQLQSHVAVILVIVPPIHFPSCKFNTAFDLLVMVVGAGTHRSTLLHMHLYVWHAVLVRAILWLAVRGAYLVLRIAFVEPLPLRSFDSAH